MTTLNFNANTVQPHAGIPDDINEQPRDTARVWSKWQTNIFDFVEHGTGNAVVEAVAGSGKTTTIVEALKRVQGSSIFLAFNKSIAEELKARGVNARTFHSLTYMPVTKHKGVRSVESNKLRQLCALHMKGQEVMLYGAFAQRLVGLARQAGVGFLVPDIEQTWMDIMIHHDIELEHEGANYSRGLELATELLTWSNESNLVDFDDLLYIAVKDGLSLPKFDFVFVDEAQDTNAIQRALLRKILKDTTRVVAVGDPAQAIYGFRGADSDSLDLIAKEFNCIKLPLTISYRCATSVVSHARQWVKHIEAAPGAPAGNVIDVGTGWKPSDFKEDDLVICRTTKPIIKLGYRLLKARIPVRILGKEIGQGLKSLINKMNSNNVDVLQERLQEWTTREIEKATAKMLDSKAAAIYDKTDAIMCLIEGLDEDDRSIFALMRTIDTLFGEAVNCVTLSTIHKAKGLEADTVYWLNSSQCPARWVRQEWQKQQEINLCYVATTRAKTSLILIEENRDK